MERKTKLSFYPMLVLVASLFDVHLAPATSAKVLLDDSVYNVGIDKAPAPRQHASSMSDMHITSSPRRDYEAKDVDTGQTRKRSVTNLTELPSQSVSWIDGASYFQINMVSSDFFPSHRDVIYGDYLFVNGSIARDVSQRDIAVDYSTLRRTSQDPREAALNHLRLNAERALAELEHNADTFNLHDELRRLLSIPDLLRESVMEKVKWTAFMIPQTAFGAVAGYITAKIVDSSDWNGTVKNEFQTALVVGAATFVTATINQI